MATSVAGREVDDGQKHKEEYTNGIMFRCLLQLLRDLLIITDISYLQILTSVMECLVQGQASSK